MEHIRTSAERFVPSVNKPPFELTGPLISCAREHLGISTQQIADELSCRVSDLERYEQSSSYQRLTKPLKRFVRAVADKGRMSNKSLTTSEQIRQAITTGKLTERDGNLLVAIKHGKVLPEDISEADIIASLEVAASDSIVFKRRDGVFQVFRASPERLRRCLRQRTDMELSCMLDVVREGGELRRRVIGKMAHVLIQLWYAVKTDRDIRPTVLLDNQFHLSWTDGYSEIACAFDALLRVPRVARENLMKSRTPQEIRSEHERNLMELHAIWLALREETPDELRIATLICSHILGTWKTVDIPIWVRQGIGEKYIPRLPMSITPEDNEKHRLSIVKGTMAEHLGDTFWKAIKHLCGEVGSRQLVSCGPTQSDLEKRFQLALAGWVGGKPVAHTDDMLIALKHDAGNGHTERNQELQKDVSQFQEAFRKYTVEIAQNKRQNEKLKKGMDQRGWSIIVADSERNPLGPGKG